MTTADRTLVRPLRRPLADRELVCIGYSGGGTAPFRQWAPLLPEHTELTLVCHPGREGRFGEPFARNWDELCDPIVEQVATQVPRPFTLFGHSMGAGVAFEVAARLEHLGRGPTALVVSASESPANWEAKRDKPPASWQSDEQLLEWMTTIGQLPAELLAEPELVRIALDLLRADMAVSDSYKYLPGTTVRAPMQVIHGEQDGTDSAEQAARWLPLAAGPVTVHSLPGGHFYTPRTWARLPEQFTNLVPG